MGTREIKLSDWRLPSDSCPFLSAMVESDDLNVDPSVGVLVAKYAEAQEVALDAVHYSSRRTNMTKYRMGLGSRPIEPSVQAILDHGQPEVEALLTADPPSHTRQRRAVTKSLGPRRLRKMEPRIREIASDLIDPFVDGNSVDLFPQFSTPFPVYVICEILGLPRADSSKIKGWADRIATGMGSILSESERIVVAHAVVEAQRYLLDAFEARRREPVDDLISELVTYEYDDGSVLSDGELLPIMLQMINAGHETTTNFITSSIVYLAQNPALAARLSATPAEIPAFVEEALRLLPPVNCSFRIAKEDMKILDVEVKEGTTVAAFWAAANVDPSVFEDPESFDIERSNSRRHMTFGFGPHICVGAELARIESRIALEMLLERLGPFVIDEEASDLAYGESLVHRGHKQVVLQFGRPSW